MPATSSDAKARDDLKEFFRTRDPAKLRAMLRAHDERVLKNLEGDGRLSLADLGIIPTPTKRR